MANLRNIYDSRRIWKVVFIAISLVLVALFLYISNNLVKDLAQQERERMEIWANATRELTTLGSETEVDADGNPIKWKVENSWGATSGQKGCLVMTNRWFREYSFRLVVDKKYVPEKILEAEKQKPVMVMPDDPLFQEDE